MIFVFGLFLEPADTSGEDDEDEIEDPADESSKDDPDDGKNDMKNVLVGDGAA